MSQSIYIQNGVWVIISKLKNLIKPIRSLKFVIFIAVFLLTLAMVFLFRINLDRVTEKNITEQKISNVQSQCNILANQLIDIDFLIDSSTDNLNAEIDQLANVYEGRIMIIDRNYKIIKDTYTIEQGKYMVSENIFEVMYGDLEKQINNIDDYTEIIMPIEDISDKNVRTIKGIIIATVSMSDVANTNEYLHQQGNTLFVLFLVISFVIALIVASLSVASLSNINNQLKVMNEAQLKEIDVKGTYSEMEDIVDNFNVIINKIQKLEDSRQEFVSNVSHELKTPITSMKVLADSLLLQEGVPAEMYREFMTDIADEIDRENQIINDLLTLVKTDQKSAGLNIEPVNLNDMLELLLKRLSPIAEERSIEIIYESVREVVAEIDDVKITLALSNLIENAIKYNIDGGWVNVNLDADHKFFYVKVSDSGVGIPEDCQDQVFERFYRVDKARSRDTGGTGLGLSITRNVILLHKGAIKVFSEVGKGTIFTVRIPLKYIVVE